MNIAIHSSKIECNPIARALGIPATASQINVTVDGQPFATLHHIPSSVGRKCGNPLAEQVSIIAHVNNVRAQMNCRADQDDVTREKVFSRFKLPANAEITAA